MGGAAPRSLCDWVGHRDKQGWGVGRLKLPHMTSKNRCLPRGHRKELWAEDQELAWSSGH